MNNNAPLSLILQILRKQQELIESCGIPGTKSAEVEGLLSQLEKAIVKYDPPALSFSGFTIPAVFKDVQGFTESLGFWIKHRQKTFKKPPTDRAIQLFVNKLAERPTRAIEAIDLCIDKAWQGFEWDWFDGCREGAFRRAGEYPEHTVTPILKV